MGGQRSHGCRRHNWFRNQTISFNESHTNLERRHRHWVGGGELLEPAECTLYKTGRGRSRAKSSFIDAFGSATGFRVGGGLVTDKPEAGRGKTSRSHRRSSSSSSASRSRNVTGDLSGSDRRVGRGSCRKGD